MMEPVEDDPKSHGFFGTSSAGSFMKQVKAAIDSKTNSPGYDGTTPQTLDKVLLSSLMPENKAASSRNRDYVLPSRKTADGLLEVYWSPVHPLYPFLHHAETEAIYHKLWTGEGKDDDVDLCLLNILLALSSQLKEDIKPDQRQANANVFFLRAREFLYNDFWEGGSIRTVQCLLLIGQYLQSTNDPQRCWMVVGLAVRLAQSLGLHLEGDFIKNTIYQRTRACQKSLGWLRIDGSSCLHDSGTTRNDIKSQRSRTTNPTMYR